jgi:hypothetical protein
MRSDSRQAQDLREALRISSGDGVAAIGKALAAIWSVTHSIPCSIIRLAGAALLIAACATSPSPRPASAPRISDSAPEKVAAQRSASHLQLEEEDQRWGFEAARARRRDADQQKKASETTPPAPGPVDVTKPPTVTPER